MRVIERDWLPPLPDEIEGEEYFRLRAGQVCSLCKMQRTTKGHDPCIKNLPGVKFACCGHGTGEGYVFFKSGQIIRGYFDGMPGSKSLPGKGGAKK